jgi:hypothetical protein
MVLSDNLVAYYKLDSLNSNIAIDFIGLYNATAINNTLNSSGKRGSCFSFDGSSSAIVTPLKSEIDNLFADSGMSWTVSAWFKVDDISANRMVYSTSLGLLTGAPFSVWVATDGKLMSRIRGTLNEVASGVNDSNWHHIVITWDGTTCYSYFDNVQSTLNVGTVEVQDRFFCIGAGNEGINNFFDGEIDEVCLWDRAISQAEVNTLYTNISPTATSALTINITGNGTVDESPDYSVYETSESVSITAVPDSESSRFRDWTGDLVSVSNPETLIMSSSKDVDVYFETGEFVESPGNYNFQLTSDVLISKPIYLNDIDVTKATIYITATSDISNYSAYLSNQGTSDWESVTNGSTHTFSDSTGREVRYKIKAINPNKSIQGVRVTINK